MSDFIEKYCEQEGYKLAQKIDDSMGFVVKPKPRWMPYWLYKKVIKEVVVLVQKNGL